jgi:hypothetical protein
MKAAALVALFVLGAVCESWLLDSGKMLPRNAPLYGTVARRLCSGSMTLVLVHLLMSMPVAPGQHSFSAQHPYHNAAASFCSVQASRRSCHLVCRTC